MRSATSRCWPPSWRSRSIRRRSLSAAARMRARDSCSSSLDVSTRSARRWFSSQTSAKPPTASRNARCSLQPGVVDQCGHRARVGLDDGDRAVGVVRGAGRRPPVGGDPAVRAARPGVHELERGVHDHLGDRAAALLGGVGGAQPLRQQQERVGRVQPPAEQAGEEPERHERQAQRERVRQPGRAAVVDHAAAAQDDPGAQRDDADDRAREDRHERPSHEARRVLYPVGEAPERSAR